MLGFWLPSPASSFGPVYTDVVPEGVLAEIDAKAHFWWLWCKGLQT